jgi:hypothetical protein
MKQLNRASEFAKARQIIDALPQRMHLSERNIEFFLAQMWAREPERLTWHALRLGGFGGSEYGTIVSNYRGKSATFGSARKLVMQKLLMILPDAPKPPMIRGIQTEDMHREMFLKHWEAERDLEAITALTAATGRYAFIRYSPDDVVQLVDRATNARHRILVDYKSPTKIEDENEIHFDYECQINGGASILEKLNLPVSYGLLSRLDWQNWACTTNWVEIRPELQEEIVDACHHYWTQYLLKGEPPPLVNQGTGPIELLSDEQARIKYLSATIVGLDEASELLREQREQAVADLKRLDRKFDMPGMKSIVFGHTITVGEVLNEERLEAALQSANVKLDDVRHDLAVNIEYDLDAMVVRLHDLPSVDRPIVDDLEGPVTYSTAKVLAAFEDQGLSPAEFMISGRLDPVAVKARLGELGVPASEAFDYPFNAKKRVKLEKDKLVAPLKSGLATLAEKMRDQLLAEVENYVVKPEMPQPVLDPIQPPGPAAIEVAIEVRTPDPVDTQVVGSLEVQPVMVDAALAEMFEDDEEMVVAPGGF